MSRVLISISPRSTRQRPADNRHRTTRLRTRRPRARTQCNGGPALGRGLRAEPKLASDQTNRLRFAAAQCTILAGSGKGKEDPPLDDPARLALLRQARRGLKPIWRPWRARVQREPSAARDRALSGCSATGKPMAISPLSATKMSWPGYRNLSGHSGVSSGATLTAY